MAEHKPMEAPKPEIIAFKKQAFGPVADKLFLVNIARAKLDRHPVTLEEAQGHLKSQGKGEPTDQDIMDLVNADILRKGR